MCRSTNDHISNKKCIYIYIHKCIFGENRKSAMLNKYYKIKKWNLKLLGEIYNIHIHLSVGLYLSVSLYLSEHSGLVTDHRCI